MRFWRSGRRGLVGGEGEPRLAWVAYRGQSNLVTAIWLNPPDELIA